MDQDGEGGGEWKGEAGSEEKGREIIMTPQLIWLGPPMLTAVIASNRARWLTVELTEPLSTEL